MNSWVRYLIVIVLALSVASPIGGANHANAAEASLRWLFGSGTQTGGKDITLRIKLTAPAPAGGIDVRLSEPTHAVHVPHLVHVAGGAEETVLTVSTEQVASLQSFPIYAILGDVQRIHFVWLKPKPEPVEGVSVSYFTLQSVIRHGGAGRLFIRLTGPAPAGGTTVVTSVVLFLGCDLCADQDAASRFQVPATITVPAGQNAISLAVPAFITPASAGSDGRLPDVRIQVVVKTPGQHFPGSALATIRDFGDAPRPDVTMSSGGDVTSVLTTAEAAVPDASPSPATDAPAPVNTVTPTVVDTSTVDVTSTSETSIDSITTVTATETETATALGTDTATASADE